MYIFTFVPLGLDGSLPFRLFSLNLYLDNLVCTCNSLDRGYALPGSNQEGRQARRGLQRVTGLYLEHRADFVAEVFQSVYSDYPLALTSGSHLNRRLVL
jgi:hypothetical protein